MICKFCHADAPLHDAICRTCGAPLKPEKKQIAPSRKTSVSSQKPTLLTQRVLDINAGRVLCLENRDGTMIIATQRGLFCWNSNDDFWTLQQPRSEWTCAAFSDETLVCGDADGNLTAWNIAKKRIVFSVSAHSGPVSSLITHQNFIASGGSDGVVKLWNTTGQKSLVFQTLENVMALEFSPQGDYLAGAFDNGILRVWKVLPSSEYSNELPQTQWDWQMARHHLWIKTLAIAPGGNALASGGYDATVRVWGLRTGHEMQHFAVQNSVSALAFAPDNRTLCAAAKHKIYLWDSWTGQRLGEFTAPAAVDALHFGNSFLAVAAGREISLWKIN